MDEVWERAVETALEGQADSLAARTLTLDGAIKCKQARLPAPSLLEKFENLQHLSIANIGISTLEQFPRLPNLQKLNLSDNRISDGLEFIVEAGLDSLRDLDLSNNRIQFIEDLAPLAKLRLVSLDLYECPVTRVEDYRSRVFGLINSLKYLDKMDAEENERLESDDDEEEEDEEEEDDPGSGEVDGEERSFRMNNGHSNGGEGIVDVDEEEESDADEEETGTRRVGNGVRQNGFRVEVVDREGEEFGEEEIDEDDDDDDVVEVHEIDDDSDDEDDDEDDEDEGDDEEDEEEVDNDDGDLREQENTGRLTSLEGEIDGHEQGEDDNAETDEEEQDVEDDVEFDDEDDGGEEDEDSDAGFLIQPVGQAEVHDAGGSDMEPMNEEEDDLEGEEEVEDDDELQILPSSSNLKRKRGDDDDDVDEGGGGSDDDDEEDEDEDDDVD